MLYVFDHSSFRLSTFKPDGPDFLYGSACFSSFIGITDSSVDFCSFNQVKPRNFTVYFYPHNVLFLLRKEFRFFRKISSFILINSSGYQFQVYLNQQHRIEPFIDVENYVIPGSVIFFEAPTINCSDLSINVHKVFHYCSRPGSC